MKTPEEIVEKALSFADSYAGSNYTSEQLARRLADSIRAYGDERAAQMRQACVRTLERWPDYVSADMRRQIAATPLSGETGAQA